MPPTVAIYGGTFNPPTKGHRMVIQSALNHVDEVWVMPNASPFKCGVEDWADRYIMCEKAFAHESVRISTFEREVSHKTRGYTVPMMEELVIAKSTRSHKFNPYFIIGEDNAETIEKKWHRGKDAIQNFNFIIIPRVKASGTRYGVGCEWYKNSSDIFLEDVQPMNISSTMIRDEFTTFWKTQPDSEDEVQSYRRLVTLAEPRVINYILDKGLYGGNGCQRNFTACRAVQEAF